VLLLRICLIVGIVAVAALTASAFLARWTQPFEILSHFRLYYAFASAGLGAVLLVARQPRAAALAGAALAANAIAIGAAVGVDAGAPGAHAPVTRVIWANLQRRQESLAAIAALARTERADIVALTELPPGGVETVHRALPDFACFIGDTPAPAPGAPRRAPPRPGAAGGAAAATSRPYAAQYADIGVYRLAAVHGRPPWSNERTDERNAVIMAGANAVATRPHGVLIGDFNAAPWSPIMLDLRHAGLHRAWCSGPLTRTWRLIVFPYYALPIDHVLSEPSVRVTSCRVGAAIGSDHFPLIFDLSPL
jgi:endonuclease/exonuclease/phosphatase (EEP) superfamily protein YafD